MKLLIAASKSDLFWVFVVTRLNFWAKKIAIIRGATIKS